VTVAERIPHDLVPLRVPSGWAVVFNTFVDLPDFDALDAQDADAYLSQAILSIVATRTTPDGWQASPDGAAVFLGWLPDGDVTGSYVVTVVVGDLAQPTTVFRHRDRDLIRRAIEVALATMLPGVTVDALPARWSELAPPEEWR
jgi:hypothetical protein